MQSNGFDRRTLVVGYKLHRCTPAIDSVNTSFCGSLSSIYLLCVVKHGLTHTTLAKYGPSSSRLKKKSRKNKKTRGAPNPRGLSRNTRQTKSAIWRHTAYYQSTPLPSKGTSYICVKRSLFRRRARVHICLLSAHSFVILCMSVMQEGFNFLARSV